MCLDVYHGITLGLVTAILVKIGPVSVHGTTASRASVMPLTVPTSLAWGAQNKIAFAPEKLEMLHLTKQKGGYAPECTVNSSLAIRPTSLGGALIWLGVWFDRKLSFKDHVAAGAAKAKKFARHIRNLARVKHGPPAIALRKAVITCVLSSPPYGTEA